MTKKPFVKPALSIVQQVEQAVFEVRRYGSGFAFILFCAFTFDIEAATDIDDRGNESLKTVEVG